MKALKTSLVPTLLSSIMWVKPAELRFSSEMVLQNQNTILSFSMSFCRKLDVFINLCQVVPCSLYNCPIFYTLIINFALPELLFNALIQLLENWLHFAQGVIPLSKTTDKLYENSLKMNRLCVSKVFLIYFIFFWCHSESETIIHLFSINNKH